jgi:hypothetical protein
VQAQVRSRDAAQHTTLADERKVWRVVHVPAVTDEDRATNNEDEKNLMGLDCQLHRRLLKRASNMNRLLSLGAALPIVLGAVSLRCNSELAARTPIPTSWLSLRHACETPGPEDPRVRFW